MRGAHTYRAGSTPERGQKRRSPSGLQTVWGLWRPLNLCLKDRLMELYHHHVRATQARDD